ncbi:MAG: hypothetical protein OEZ57_09830, partial [Nitrospirota bacterium]|nr:hypothetical protein [Nitrospirota bacterium]
AHRQYAETLSDSGQTVPVHYSSSFTTFLGDSFDIRPLIHWSWLLACPLVVVKPLSHKAFTCLSGILPLKFTNLHLIIS